MLVLPLMLEQRLTGERIEALQVGLSVTSQDLNEIATALERETYVGAPALISPPCCWSAHLRIFAARVPARRRRSWSLPSRCLWGLASDKAGSFQAFSRRYRRRG